MEGQDELYLYKVLKYKRGYYYQVASSVILGLKFNIQKKLAKTHESYTNTESRLNDLYEWWGKN